MARALTAVLLLWPLLYFFHKVLSVKVVVKNSASVQSSHGRKMTGGSMAQPQEDDYNNETVLSRTVVYVAKDQIQRLKTEAVTLRLSCIPFSSRTILFFSFLLKFIYFLFLKL